MSQRRHLVGLILAGGRARRMGGVDKALLRLGGETLIERAIARAAPQVSEIVISANGDPARFSHFAKTVIEDRVGGYLGPLAGILAGLEWMRATRPAAQWLASFACDCPFFPPDLVERLIGAANAAQAAIAIGASGRRHHPVFGVWRADIAATSVSVLGEQGLRKMDDFIALFPNVRVPFPVDPVDPFFNINTPEDLAHAEALAVHR